MGYDFKVARKFYAVIYTYSYLTRVDGLQECWSEIHGALAERTNRRLPSAGHVLPLPVYLEAPKVAIGLPRIQHPVHGGKTALPTTSEEKDPGIHYHMVRVAAVVHSCCAS